MFRECIQFNVVVDHSLMQIKNMQISECLKSSLKDSTNIKLRSAIFYQWFNFSPNENENEKSFLDEIKKNFHTS